MKAINPNAEGNQGIVNFLKICLRILSGVVHMTLKNHATLQSYKSFLTEKKSFCYTDEVTTRSVFCGIILLKLVTNGMKPHIIVNIQNIDKWLDKINLQTCVDN